MKITVITVCLNSRNTIEKTIKSVIAQAGQGWDLEYIVVDGASTDGTVAIIQKYDSYITQYISERDLGIFDAMNKGISMASGDVIAFLNSDDWYEENALGSVMAVFADDDCDCVCCDNYVVGKNGKRQYFDASGQSIEDLRIQMIYYHSSIFGRKKLFRKNENFNTQYRYAADYDWFLGSMEKGAKLRYIHQPVFTFCYGGISSVNEIECAREARRIALAHLQKDEDMYRDRIDRRLCEVVLHALDKKMFHSKLAELFGKNRSNIIWGAGGRGKQWAAWLREGGVNIEAVVDSNNLLWGGFIGTIPICSPKILERKSCNLIITPEKYISEIKHAVGRINSNICIFEGNTLCRILAESAVSGLLIE